MLIACLVDDSYFNSTRPDVDDIRFFQSLLKVNIIF